MRYYPTEESDQHEAERLGAPSWMLEQLKLNPRYVSWGPHEDYMWNHGDGWDSAKTFGSWLEFGPWNLDDLNEVVNFYFDVERPARDCEICGGNGTHPDAQWISESFYSHSSPFKHQTDTERSAEALLAQFGAKHNHMLGFGVLPPEEVLNRYGTSFLDFCVRTIERGGYWNDDITDDEAAALVEARRADGADTAAAINAAQRGPVLERHDAINRWILIKQRCKRLGVPLHCSACEGEGGLFTGPARLDLILWVLHPRKGCSRGIEVQGILESELPAIYAYLKSAAWRNQGRFSAVVLASERLPLEALQ